MFRLRTADPGRDQPEDADSYEDDPNDPGVMAQVYPRYVHAFRNKEQAYRGLLRPRADVAELGPHLEAFLQTARSGTGDLSGSTSALTPPPLRVATG